METVKQRYTVDDLWDLVTTPGNGDMRYELIDGELVEMAPTNFLHSIVGSRINLYLRAFAMEHDLGEVSTESGHYFRFNRFTLLGPDIAFVSNDRLPRDLPESFADFMPDLAVEVLSPSNTPAEMNRKTDIYLRSEVRLVWIVNPREKSVEVFRLGADDRIESETLTENESLSGEDVLPGFTLPIANLFPKPRD